jgi:predicted AlkP superfamily phosphohydrolase/phosphomutase
VVSAVYKREDIFQGPRLSEAPDLFVGFNSGYRVSWQTSAGGIPPDVFEDNLNNWSGDHCSVAPDQTAGIFFANRPLPPRYRSIMDIGPTALAELGVPVPTDLEGTPLQSAPAGSGDDAEE